MKTQMSFCSTCPKPQQAAGSNRTACDNRIRSNQIRHRQKQYRCDLPLRWCSTEWGRSVRPEQEEHEGEQNEKKIWLAKLKTEMTSLFSSCCWRDISLHFFATAERQRQKTNMRKLTVEIFALVRGIFLLKHLDVHHYNLSRSISTAGWVPSEVISIPRRKEKKTSKLFDQSDILATNFDCALLWWYVTCHSCAIACL